MLNRWEGKKGAGGQVGTVCYACLLEELNKERESTQQFLKLKLLVT